MALVTIVRSLVGRKLSLPGGVTIREWHFVEIAKPLTDEQKVELKRLIALKEVQVSQLRGGAPLSSVDLTVAKAPESTGG